VSPVWITVIVLLLLIWVKPPDGAAGKRIVDAMAAILVAAVVLTLVLESAGTTLSWYQLYPPFDDFIESDNAGYWLPLAEPLGLDGRWAGPFPHPNMAGPVGGFLIVVGLCRRGWLQWAAIVTGVLVLVLTSSRTSTIAALVGAVVVLVAAAFRNWPRSWLSRAALLGTPVLIAALLLGTAAYTTPAGAVTSTGVSLEQFSSLSGRTSIWPVYLRIWQESLWFGVPEGRIMNALQSGELPGWAITAHNLPLDTLVRFGILGGLLVAVALGVAAVMALRAAAGGRSVGLGTLAVIFTSGLTEALVFWRILTASTILLFLAVLASVPEPTEPGVKESSSPGPP
jgi:O-antigen ligase